MLFLTLSCAKSIPPYTLHVINRTPYKDLSAYIAEYSSGKQGSEIQINLQIAGVDEKVEFFDEFGRPRGFSMTVLFFWNVKCPDGREMKGERRIKRIFSAPSPAMYSALRSNIKRQIAREIVRFLEKNAENCAR